MADDYDMQPDKKKKKKTKFNKSILLKILCFVIFLAILTGVGFGTHSFMLKKKRGNVENSSLKKEVLLFLFEFMPEIHADVVALSDEIYLSKDEIKRIETIEKKYPNQNKITGSEKKLWAKNLSTLEKFRDKYEKVLRDIYVSYHVNNDVGIKLMEERKEELKTTTTEMITLSKNLTDKIRKMEEAKSFMDKLKEKVF